MNKSIRITSLIFALASLITASCNKETLSLDTEKINDYYPLRIGKYITYKLDSTVYVNLGTQKLVRSYIVQDRIDSVITDNLGRPSFKVKRMVRDTKDTTRWNIMTAYLVTYDSTKKRLELVQDNQRYLKMLEPIRKGFSWNAHVYINTTSFPDLQYLDQWKYEYIDVKSPQKIGSLNLNETVTVLQNNDTLGNPSNKNFYFEINSAREIYAKNIGLVYKEFLHEAWQPPNANSNSGYFESNSYGIKLTVLNHNF